MCYVDDQAGKLFYYGYSLLGIGYLLQALMGS